MEKPVSYTHLNQDNQDQLEAMADELCKEYIAQNDTLANKNDLTALFRIGYGLYVVTSNDGKKDNGLIVNTVIQLTDKMCIRDRYLFSQWEICSRSTDSFSIWMAFSTGITCIPIPAPPSGTNGVIFSSGRRDICSKKVPISGLESRMFAFMLKNSAHPGTYIGNT